MPYTDVRALTDDALIARTAERDQRAFAELHRRFRPRVLGLAIRLVIDRAIAEEVTQGVFLELWQHADRFEPGRGAFANWLLTITRQRAVSQIRSEEASRRRLVTVGVREVPVDRDVVEEAIEASELRVQAREALRRLSDAHRETLLLYYGGRTQREVAELLRVPVNTVKTRVRDALIRLNAIELAPAA